MLSGPHLNIGETDPTLLFLIRSHAGLYAAHSSLLLLQRLSVLVREELLCPPRARTAKAY